MAQPAETHFLWRPQLRDPGDEMVLEAAVKKPGGCACHLQHEGLWRGVQPFRNRTSASADSNWKDHAMKETRKYLLRLPRSLKEAVERLSREDQTSINQFVATAVTEKVSALQTAIVRRPENEGRFRRFR